eukprot:8142228-Alexandrium_andersonii.AAC.1
MSASLVGSEMCIRDSSGAWRALPSDLRCRTSTVHESARLMCAVCAPVSYTHLTLPTICAADDMQ